MQADKDIGEKADISLGPRLPLGGSPVVVFKLCAPLKDGEGDLETPSPHWTKLINPPEQGEGCVA